jgi:Oligosaccharyl transferase STT3 subunit
MHTNMYITDMHILNIRGNTGMHTGSWVSILYNVAFRGILSSKMGFFGNIIRTVIFGYILYASVDIRLDAVRNYGKVIHEFDPWFNYRATEYLVNNGYERFNNWYDEESW